MIRQVIGCGVGVSRRGGQSHAEQDCRSDGCYAFTNQTNGGGVFVLRIIWLLVRFHPQSRLGGPGLGVKPGNKYGRLVGLRRETTRSAVQVVFQRVCFRELDVIDDVASCRLQFIQRGEREPGDRLVRRGRVHALIGFPLPVMLALIMIRGRCRDDVACFAHTGLHGVPAFAVGDDTVHEDRLLTARSADHDAQLIKVRAIPTPLQAGVLQPDAILDCGGALRVHVLVDGFMGFRAYDFRIRVTGIVVLLQFDRTLMVSHSALACPAGLTAYPCETCAAEPGPCPPPGFVRVCRAMPCVVDKLPVDRVDACVRLMGVRVGGGIRVLSGVFGGFGILLIDGLPSA